MLASVEAKCLAALTANSNRARDCPRAIAHIPLIAQLFISLAYVNRGNVWYGKGDYDRAIAAWVSEPACSFAKRISSRSQCTERSCSSANPTARFRPTCP
jgi:hypothetical protein